MAAAAVALLWAQMAAAATIWSFDLPATATASQTPPYPVVATLTLTQTPHGVQFVPAIPEPGASALLSMGVLALGLRRRSVAIRTDERSPSGAQDELPQG